MFGCCGGGNLGESERERERESERETIALAKEERERDFGSSTAPLLGGLCCSLASGESWGVDLDCTSRGAFPVLSAVLESHI